MYSYTIEPIDIDFGFSLQLHKLEGACNWLSHFTDNQWYGVSGSQDDDRIMLAITKRL